MPPLTPEHWRIVSPYLDRALDLEPAERVLWLDALRAQHPALAAEVETLLAEHAVLQKQGYLDDGAGPLPD